MDRVKAPAVLQLEYDLTAILAYWGAALIVCMAVGIIVGVTAGYVLSMKREIRR